MATSTVVDRARIVWSMRLSSAVRSALACAIVGGATLYGPKFLAHQIKFAAFSYLTAVIIVSDATLGDTLRSCWHAFCATAQVVPLSMLGRWIIDTKAGLPISMASVAVAVASFLLALPECTHLTAKKIAFGQIVLVWSDAVLGDGSSDGFMHPLYVAASTALGALASVLALLVPCPGLASSKVRKLCRVYAENASQRMNIFLRAFSVTDNHTKMKLISQAKPLSETGAKLLQSIRILEEGIRWERPWSRVGLAERLRRMELQMRGMEYSLVSSPGFLVQVTDEEQFCDFLQSVWARIEEKIEQVRCFSPSHSTVESETRELTEKPSIPLESTFPLLKNGWMFLSFSCIDMFLNDTKLALPREREAPRAKTKFSIIRTLGTWIKKITSYERLEFAFKCSLSLGLAVLLGLIFDKENGCWAGLTIAISFVTGRQAIFTIANTRAQGTAIGSVYGVICCFLFHDEEVRLVAILPWIIFTSFLRYSKMYGQTGGVSAAIGALLILGRKNYGVPNEFAIARLTEVVIGLSAFIVVELFLQPIRAATLAQNHLFLTLYALQDCIKETGVSLSQKNQTIPKLLELRQKQRNLNTLVCELKEIVADAELEPDFWYLPFRTSSYQKLVGSLSNILDMLHFITYNFEVLSGLLQTSTISKEFQEQINDELELSQETLTSSQTYLISTEFEADSEEVMDGNSRDIEAGKLRNTENQTVLITENKEAEWTAQEEDNEDNKKVKETTIRCLGAVRFCISSVMKELEDIKICAREIDQWENHSSQ